MERAKAPLAKPRHVRTPERERLVRVLVDGKCIRPIIEKALGVSNTTLTKYYGDLLPESMGGEIPYVATDELRRIVRARRAAGLTDAEIALLMGISEKTVQRHYRAELDTGQLEVVAAVGNRLIKKALSDEPDALGAAKFYLSARAGWSEKRDVTLYNGDAEILAVAQRVAEAKARRATSSAVTQADLDRARSAALN